MRTSATASGARLTMMMPYDVAGRSGRLAACAPLGDVA